ncbi:hypothetical protein [Devosia sp. DBB001]|nr:hypothetical protein [Devosia sp. DBB001]
MFAGVASKVFSHCLRLVSSCPLARNAVVIVTPNYAPDCRFVAHVWCPLRRPARRSVLERHRPPAPWWKQTILLNCRNFAAAQKTTYTVVKPIRPTGVLVSDTPTQV